MRHSLVALLLLVGWLVGRALPRPVVAPRPPLVEGPICEPNRPSPPPVTCDVARHDTCWDTLAERVAPRPTIAVGFEAATGVELPENFVPTLEEEVAGCDPGAVVEVTDCSSYPCVAAVRPGVDWFEQSCTFGSYGDAELVVLPIDVACPGGPERMWFASLVDESSARAAMGLAEDEEPNGLIAGLLGQRVDTLLEMWPCTGS